MPAQRTKIRCAFAEEAEPKAKKPRAPRKALTEEEKEEAKEKREARKALKEAKKEWEESLVPWKRDELFRWPSGTLGMYKSDAKSSYSLTENDLASLPHESIANSPKTFYRYHDVEELAMKKWANGAMKDDYEPPEVKGTGQIRLFKKTITDERNANRRVRTNWSDLGFVYVRMIGAYDGSRESQRKKDGQGSSSAQA
ncbi:hypothetical protein VKT23_007813 [Stygiomarasmius scandens]|uniref:Uncharacterized protein n=1 Tax=Marasmiellus scandens TaxID=2682957 RepID=A0ABR1JL61_9AGAR